MRVLSGALTGALAAAALLALADVWQVAFLNPGSLSAATVAWLAGLYLAAGLLAGLAIAALAAVAGRGATGARTLGIGITLGAGAAILLAEAGLRQLQPLSSWRPLVVVAACAGGLALGVLAARVRRIPRAAAVAAAALFLVGGVGAARGFRAAAPASPGAAVAPASGPNILVILIDTLRADHLGTYGYERPTSPHIDALARESVQFDRAYSQSTWTKPATASLMTGRYPSQHQAYLEKAKLPESELLLPEALRAAGYRTGVFSGNPWVTREWGFDQGVDHFVSIYDERFARVTLFMMSLKRLSKLVDQKARAYNKVKLLVQGELSTTARDDVTSAALLRWIAAGGDRPFYAHLQLMSPHHPYDPPPPYDRFVPDRTHAPVTYYPRKTYFFFEEGDPLPDAARADMMARYDGDILYADTVVGRVLDALRGRGLLDRTVVVLVSDHGEEFYDHHNWGHGQSVYEELTHVPLLVRYPAAFPAGRHVTVPVRTVDLMPTLLALAGAPPLDSLAGRSLLPLVAGRAQDDGDVYSELLYRYGEGRALVAGSAKVIHLRKDTEARSTRFDLAGDPAEQHPLPADGPEGAPLLERLETTSAWARAHRSAPVERELDPEMQKRLRALGYLD